LDGVISESGHRGEYDSCMDRYYVMRAECRLEENEIYLGECDRRGEETIRTDIYVDLGEYIAWRTEVG